MIKTLEVSSNYEQVRPPKGSSWLAEVYVVQRQCLRATTGSSRTRTPRVPRETLNLEDVESSVPGPGADIFEIDLEFADDPLRLVEF